MTHMAQPLRKLGPEPWGDRMRRARESVGFTHRRVEEALAPHLSRSTVMRLEALASPPTSPRARAHAAMLLSLYGFDLADLELSADDLPPAVDRRALLRLVPDGTEGGRSRLRNKCFGAAA